MTGSRPTPRKRRIEQGKVIWAGGGDTVEQLVEGWSIREAMLSGEGEEEEEEEEEDGAR